MQEAAGENGVDVKAVLRNLVIATAGQPQSKVASRNFLIAEKPRIQWEKHYQISGDCMTCMGMCGSSVCNSMGVILEEIR
jgi:hypothetical protein